MHNMLVRMNQAGVFVAEISMEDDDVNIITEMFDDNADAATVGVNELQEVAAALEEEEEGVGYEELIEMMLLHENEFSSMEMHDAIMNELMDKFEAEDNAVQAAAAAN